MSRATGPPRPTMPPRKASRSRQRSERRPAKSLIQQGGQNLRRTSERLVDASAELAWPVPLLIAQTISTGTPR
jgi:hypothetical protein